MRTIIPLTLCLICFSGIAEEAQTNSLDEVRNSLSELIWEFDVLEDFWYGDDGVDCGEPELTIESIDFKDKLVKIEVFQNAVTWGCSQRPFHCDLKFQVNEKDEISFMPFNTVKDCTN